MSKFTQPPKKIMDARTLLRILYIQPWLHLQKTNLSIIFYYSSNSNPVHEFPEINYDSFNYEIKNVIKLPLFAQHELSGFYMPNSKNYFK